MHTVFEMPPPWQSREENRLLVWTRPGTGIRVEVDPLIPLPDDRKAWGERVLGRDMPEAGSLEQTEIVNANNKAGWPTTIVSTTIRDRQQQVVELRVSLFYEFVYYGASLVCRIPSADVASFEQEHKLPILEAMMSVTPSFSGPDVPAISELWEMTPSKRQ